MCIDTKTNNKIAFELPEDVCEMLDIMYETKKDKYASFEEYLEAFTEYIELQAKREILEGKLKEVKKQIDECDYVKR